MNELTVTRWKAFGGMSSRDTRIRGRKPSRTLETHWSTGNRWEWRSLKTRFPGVSPGAEDEVDAETPRKLID